LKMEGQFSTLQRDEIEKKNAKKEGFKTNKK
jgi:hypothetical protein